MASLVAPVLSAIEKGDTKNIFSLALPESSPTRSYFSDAEFIQMDSQFHSSFQTLGKCHGYEEILTSDIPGVFMLKYHVFKFQRQPVIIKFRLYKPNKEWRVNAFEIDDTIQASLEESAKWRLGNIGFSDVRKEIEKNNK